jgi:hypothetical protein
MTSVVTDNEIDQGGLAEKMEEGGSNNNQLNGGLGLGGDAQYDPPPSNDGSLIELQPLFPKTTKEKLTFGLHMTIIPMLISGFTGSCPAIHGEEIFILCYGSVTIISNGLEFYYSLNRPGHDQVYSKQKKIKDFLGLFQLLIGVYGMFLIFSNLRLFNNPSPDTCELGVLIALLVPSCIMGVVFVILLCMAAYFLWKKQMYPASTNDGQHDEGGDDEYVALS